MNEVLAPYLFISFLSFCNVEGLIICGEATEKLQSPLVFSASLVDVDAEVCDSSVSEVK